MVDIYGTNTIPSDQITVRSGGTVTVSAAFETTLGLVGGMNTSTGEASTGAVQTLQSRADAESAFGENSELATQVSLGLQNGAGTVYAVGVPETESTETVTGSSSGTLDNTPFDPNVQPEHTFDVTDTSEAAEVAVNVVYGTPTQPADANTMEINPITGEWAADESSDYEFVYTYGDYTTAVEDVVAKTPRIVAVLTENETVANTLATGLEDNAEGFQFSTGVVGATPEVEASSYSDTYDTRRLSVVAAPRGFTDAAETEMVRTVGAVAGKQAGKGLGDSTTYEGLNGLTGLNTHYTNDQLSTLIDNQVLPLKQSGSIDVVKDMTTSTDVRFERIYVSEIVDEATEISHRINKQFIGTANTEDNRLQLRESHTTSFAELSADDLLEDYYVAVSKGADDFTVDVTVGLDVIGVMDTIDVTISVGDVITNGGAS